MPTCRCKSKCNVPRSNAAKSSLAHRKMKKSKNEKIKHGILSLPKNGKFLSEYGRREILWSIQAHVHGSPGRIHARFTIRLLKKKGWYPNICFDLFQKEYKNLDQ
jgi:hypothetical protein